MFGHSRRPTLGDAGRQSSHHDVPQPASNLGKETAQVTTEDISVGGKSMRKVIKFIVGVF